MIVQKSRENNEFNNFLKKAISSDSLFHYTSSDIALNYILLNGTLRFSEYSKTNDPYEYEDLNLSAHCFGKNESMYISRRNVESQLNDLRKDFCKIACFTVNDENISQMDNNNDQSSIFESLGCCKPRMWAQYGENHFGVCFMFSKSSLLYELNLYHQDVFPDMVSYSINNRWRKELDVDVNQVYNLGEALYVIEHIKNHRSDIFFKKHKDYADENEFRILVISESKDALFLKINKSLRAIIIGDRFKHGLIPSLKYFEKRYHVPCYEVKWENGCPLLENINQI